MRRVGRARRGLCCVSRSREQKGTVMLRFALIACALGGTLTAGQGTTLQAEPITRHFSGVLTYIPEGNPLSLTAGAPIVGHVTWDPASLDVYPFSLPLSGPDSLGTYTKQGPISPNELVASIGGVAVPQL